MSPEDVEAIRKSLKDAETRPLEADDVQAILREHGWTGRALRADFIRDEMPRIHESLRKRLLAAVAD